MFLGSHLNALYCKMSFLSLNVVDDQIVYYQPKQIFSKTSSSKVKKKMRLTNLLHHQMSCFLIREERGFCLPLYNPLFPLVINHCSCQLLKLLLQNDSFYILCCSSIYHKGRPKVFFKGKPGEWRVAQMPQHTSNHCLK